MKNILLIAVAALALGGGCLRPEPRQLPEIRPVALAPVSGIITEVFDSDFLVKQVDSQTGEPSEEIVMVAHNAGTRFAEPDGSGIGAPIAKPEIRPGLGVIATGQGFTTAPYPTLVADNIIFLEEGERYWQ